MPEKQVEINAKVAFGEINVYIPRDWKVINKVAVSMGDCDDRASSIPGVEDGVTCIITGSVSFGDLQIVKV